MVSKKSNRAAEDIDEAFLLQSINEKADEPKAQEKPVLQPEISNTSESEKSKEVKEPARRKRNQADYSSIFLQRNELKERSCVYISKRIHNTISEIVRCIANREVTVGGYIDSVILQHLETHRDEINEMYKRERKDLIEF